MERAGGGRDGEELSSYTNEDLNCVGLYIGTAESVATSTLAAEAISQGVLVDDTVKRLSRDGDGPRRCLILDITRYNLLERQRVENDACIFGGIRYNRSLLRAPYTAINYAVAKIEYVERGD